MPASVPVLRVGRPVSDLGPHRRFYCDGLGLSVLAEFAGHRGFSGLIVGHRHAPWHLELVHEAESSAEITPGPEDLVVVYLPDKAEWQAAVDRMQAQGYEPVPPNNPYWADFGMTYEDPDGYRVVLQRAAWTK